MRMEVVGKEKRREGKGREGGGLNNWIGGRWWRRKGEGKEVEGVVEC